MRRFSSVLSSVGLREFPGRLGTCSLCFRDRLRMGKGWMPGGLCAPVDRMLDARGVLKPSAQCQSGMWGIFYECSALAFDFNSS